MGKKDKKKGKGAEKTAAKTEKKTVSRIKKELKAKGEEDVETLLAKFAEEDKKTVKVVDELCREPPSKRSSFTLLAHPEKEQLFMFGGEHFNGRETVMYSDLFFYTIKQDRWHRIVSPGGPSPRSAHQAVAVAQNGGEMWVFGGEFTSKFQSQFYHYSDLWVFSFANKNWRKILVKGGPSARSGHRMAVSKKKLFVFGGFHDNGYDCKYYNDVYSFDLENYVWNKLEPNGKAPSPRSACGLAMLSDGRLLVYGGYSIEKQPGNKEGKGVANTDMFYLVPDKHDSTGLKYKWVTVKQTGDIPTPSRCSFSFSVSPAMDDKAYLFGGVNDTEDDEDCEPEGQFFDELYQLDLTNGHWTELFVTGKRSSDEGKKRRRRRKSDGNEEVVDRKDEEATDEDAEDEEMSERLEGMAVMPVVTDTVTVTDGVFTITQRVGPSTSSAEVDEEPLHGRSLLRRASGQKVFVPPPRMSGGVTAKKGVLYLYGGIYEEDEKQLVLNDFYALDVGKLEEWCVIKALDPKDLEWFESDSEESGDDDDDHSTSDESLL